MSCCLTCGRPYPTSKVYATREARDAGRLAKHKARVDARAEYDRTNVLPHLPAEFGSGDVGRACRAARHAWCEAQSVLIRCEARGWIARVPMATTLGRRVVRRWRLLTGDA